MNKNCLGVKGTLPICGNVPFASLRSVCLRLSFFVFPHARREVFPHIDLCGTFGTV